MIFSHLLERPNLNFPSQWWLRDRVGAPIDICVEFKSHDVTLCFSDSSFFPATSLLLFLNLHFVWKGIHSSPAP